MKLNKLAKKAAALMLTGSMLFSAGNLVFATEADTETSTEATIDYTQLLNTDTIKALLADREQTAEIISYVLDQAKNINISEEEINHLIDMASSQFDITVTDDQKSSLASLVKSLQEINITSDQVKDVVNGIYDTMDSLGISADDLGGYVDKALDLLNSFAGFLK